MERRLHRGLEALMGKARVPIASASSIQAIPVDAVRPNPAQPRKHFDEARLRELQESIDRDGLLQPIVVRRVDEGFELIAGERRLRACKALGLVRIPAMVRTVTGDEQLALALIENLQRSDLDPIEEALGLKRLQDDFGLTHIEVAGRIGKERSTVTNSLRLLELPEHARAAIAQGLMRAGHGRALLALVGEPAFDEALERVIRDGLSVRQTEVLAKEYLAPSADAGAPTATPAAFATSTSTSEPPTGLDEDVDDDSASDPSSPRTVDRRTPAVLDLEDRLRGMFGVPVRVQVSRRGGAVTFRCSHRRELDHLIDALLDTGLKNAARNEDDGSAFHV